MKSLLFVLYGIMVLAAPRHINTNSALCQVSGFFYSLGLEAADAAVFLIALHSTIFIFWPNRASGDSGLYPYRRYAYTFYGLWPILMASLAFVRGSPAYVNTGQSCYLPTTPWWYRGLFSWIPRYLILLIILIMYGASYTYVRVMMRRYRSARPSISSAHPSSMSPQPTSPSSHVRTTTTTDPQVHAFNMLRQGSTRVTSLDSTNSPGGDASLRGLADYNFDHDDDAVAALDQATFEGSGILRSRDRVRRQLRLLFIYPAVYACVWVFPFAADILKFHHNQNPGPLSSQELPRWMLFVSLISLASQGLCDSAVIWARERPWRHMRVGFWRSCGLDFFQTGWWFGGRKDSGRTREEIFNQGATARSRRDEEVGREGQYGQNPGGRMLATAGGVDWWDVEEGGNRGVDNEKERDERDERAKEKEVKGKGKGKGKGKEVVVFVDGEASKTKEGNH